MPLEREPLTLIRAVLFDLHGTIAYCEDGVGEAEISQYLFGKGYEVSPQQLKAAWSFVSLVDYPKYGYGSWRSFFSRILWRLDVNVDDDTLDRIARLLGNNSYQLYPDAAEAVAGAKRSGFKTAIVTTIARFKFDEAIQSIGQCFDFVMTGYEAGCDKSNPRMYRRILEILGVEPQEAVMIGDETQLDILLPRRLGMHTILLDREGKTTERSGPADAFVYNLGDAVKAIIEWRGRSQ
jgi:HAD superfamily hydrolase (TIGR01549 family)